MYCMRMGINTTIIYSGARARAPMQKLAKAERGARPLSVAGASSCFWSQPVSCEPSGWRFLALTASWGKR
jgi:hypothetical protein